MLLRNRIDANFSQIPNELIIDDELSAKALRIVLYLFSKPDNWNVNNADIQKTFNIKRRETMSKYWKEILKTGWVSRERKTTDYSILNGYDYHLSITLKEKEHLKSVYGLSSQKSGLCQKTVHGVNRTHSNTDNLSNTKDNNSDSGESPNASLLKSKKQKIPYRKIVDLYHKMLPELRGIAELTPTRKRYIKNLFEKQLPDQDHWENYFDFIRKSDFLMGKVPAIPPRTKPFSCNLEWITKPDNFVQISEDKYHGE